MFGPPRISHPAGPHPSYAELLESGELGDLQTDHVDGSTTWHYGGAGLDWH
jgi:hypothetical protein